METFKKLLLLPSNNKYKYNSLIEVQLPKVEVMLLIKSNWASSSPLDSLYSFVSLYTNVKRPQRLLFKDAEYLYFYFLSLINNKTTFDFTQYCEHCNEKKSVEVDISTLDVTYLKSYNETSVHVKGFELRFVPRTLEHCYHTATKSLESDSNLTKIYNFLEPQFCGGFYGSEKLHSSDFQEVFSALNLSSLSSVLKEVKNENYGLPSQLTHHCSKCENQVTLQLFDPVAFSSYYTPEEVTQKTSKDFYKTVVSVAGSKTLSFSEFLNLPVTEVESVTEAVSDYLKTKYGKSGKNYFDEFQEEY